MLFFGVNFAKDDNNMDLKDYKAKLSGFHQKKPPHFSPEISRNEVGNYKTDGVSMEKDPARRLFWLRGHFRSQLAPRILGCSLTIQCEKEDRLLGFTYYERLGRHKKQYQYHLPIPKHSMYSLVAYVWVV